MRVTTLCTVVILLTASLSGCTGTETGDDTPADTQEVEPIEIYPGEDIQYIVDNSPAASTFLLKSGIHRMQELWPRAGDTFEGENGTILSGARVLPEFSRSNDLWYSANQTQEGPRHGDQLEKSITDEKSPSRQPTAGLCAVVLDLRDALRDTVGSYD